MTNQTITRSVPIPNRLFDEILPNLTDTELRVLLIVFRSTAGWRISAPDGTSKTKERDWISHAQMQRRTGRSSVAVSRAVQSLVAKSLIRVENVRGEPLASSQMRQAHFGRVFYAPSALWITSPIRYIAKVLTTTDSVNNIHRDRAVDNSGAPEIRTMRSAASGFERIGTILNRLPGSDDEAA